jgi:hypothetical protein|tara:strand:+ start:751 stop:1032 length:282 start_codon:yes stop_codon:yes gene_type:complete
MKDRVKILKDKIINDDKLAYGNKEYLLSFFDFESFVEDLQQNIKNDLKKGNFDSIYEACNYWINSEIGLKAMSETFNEILEMIEDDLINEKRL